MKDALLKIVEGGDPVLERAAAWFARMHADDASESDHRRWRAWLDGHARNREAYARIERTWSEFGEFASTPQLARRIAALPRAAAPTDRARRRRRVLHGLAAMAAMLVVAIAGLRTFAPEPGGELLYVSAIGERFGLQLEDGTHVDLDTDSRLRVRYTREARDIVLERGRARFDVTRDPARPLTVSTRDGGVRALGTRFEVYRRDSSTDVALFEGKVDLLSVAGADASRRTLATLAPGQRARLDANGAPPRISAFRADAVAGWVDGRLSFDNAPLGSAAADFNRYHAQPRLRVDPALAALPVSGVFRSDDPSAFVEALQAAYGISADPAADGGIRLSASRPAAPDGNDAPATNP